MLTIKLNLKSQPGYTEYIFHVTLSWSQTRTWQCDFSFLSRKAYNTSVLPLLAVNVTSFSSTCEILSSSSAWSVTDPSLSWDLDFSFKSPLRNTQHST